MFTWKNIKETWEDKVTYGLDTKEKTLGVLEVVGKSVVSLGTEIGKEILSAGKSASKLKDQSDEELKNIANGRDSYLFDDSDTDEMIDQKNQRRDHRNDRRMAKLILEKRKRDSE